ncbi:MAG TPA: MaoC family dehydratase [Syntrophales bacterium]|nr:MaoC family dehydratase [Syntrophales bacterium]
MKERRHFEVGEEATLKWNFSREDFLLFARLFGDKVSNHPGATESKELAFGSRVPHGMMLGSMISTLLEQELPGPGAVYLSQSLQFLAPVHPGDELTATVMVTNWDARKGRLTLWTEISNHKGVTLLTGEARLAMAFSLEGED